MVSLKGYFPDPKIQKEYERSLGRYLVAFNRIEGAIRDAVEELCSKDPELWGKLRNQQLRQQVLNLRLATANISDFPIIPYDDILDMASKRNNYAHGNYHPTAKHTNYTLHVRSGQKVIEPSVMEADIKEAEDFADELSDAIYGYFYS